MSPRAHSPCLPGVLSLGLALAAALPARGGDPVEDASRLAGEWVKVRAETAQLEDRWQQEKALLGATVQGLQERVDRLTEKRDHLLAVTATEREELAGLGAKAGAAREHLAGTEQRLRDLTARVLALRPRLPPRLAAAVELAGRSLAGESLSPGERMQLLMTVLNRCNQFNATITHGEEVLALPGSPGPAAVEVIYWGLSHGYALDRAAGRAWLGSAGPERWSWEPLPDAVPAVERLIAIRLDRENPVLVAVPVRTDAGAR